MVGTHNKIFRTNTYTVLEVLLIFIQRIILVDIFHIWGRLIRCIIALRTAITIRRVALRVVDILITLQDRSTHLIPVTATEIVIVITCRVSKDAVEYSLVHLSLYLVEVSTLIEFLFLGIGQTVETNILQGTTATGCCKSIGHRTLSRNLTPLSISKTLAAINRHTALIELLAISQNIFAHLTQIDIEISSIFIGIRLFTGIEEWIKQPELDIFNVCLFEIIGIEFTHHTAPVELWILQCTICLQVFHIKVIRTRL